MHDSPWPSRPDIEVHRDSRNNLLSIHVEDLSHSSIDAVVNQAQHFDADEN